MKNKKNTLFSLEIHDLEDRFVIVRYDSPSQLRSSEIEHLNAVLRDAGARQVLFDPTGTKIESYDDEQLRRLGLTRLN